MYQPTSHEGRAIKSFADEMLAGQGSMTRGVIRPFLEKLYEFADRDPDGLREQARPHVLRLAVAARLDPAELAAALTSADAEACPGAAAEAFAERAS